MSEYDIGSYGSFWAPYYDEIFRTADSEVAFLLPLAGSPPRALELAIGSGRVGLPLMRAGVEVTGIDISDEMVGLLRAKPGGEKVNVVKGDFADVAVEETFPLVYLPFNTLFALTSQERQIECFRNVARALDPGGRFVLDTFVPDLRRYDHLGTRMGVSSISSNETHAYEMSIHNSVEQSVASHHVRRLEDGSTVVLPVEIRYAWPAEMDLMARLAGLSLEERWGWYDRRQFTEQSLQHVSVYRKPSVRGPGGGATPAQ
jgi:SAM-dependent methyltransferase